MSILDTTIKIVSFTGGSVGLILGALKLHEYLDRTRLKNLKEKFYFHAADNFIKNQQFHAALEQLNLVLQQDEDNMKALKKSIDCEFEIVQKEALHTSYPAGLAYLVARQNEKFCNQERINPVLKKLYYFRSLYPKADPGDIAWMEARLHVLHLGLNISLEIVKQALKKYPYHLGLRAEQAMLVGLTTHDLATFEQSSFELDTLAEKEPQNPLYHYYNACIWNVVRTRLPQLKNFDEKVLQYSYAASVRVSDDAPYWNRYVLYQVNELGLNIYHTYYRHHGSVAHPELKIPLPERIDMITQFLNQRDRWINGDSINCSNVWLMQLYLATEQPKRAYEAAQSLIQSSSIFKEIRPSANMAGYFQLELTVLREVDQDPDRQQLLEAVLQQIQGSSVSD